jgi:DNA-binding phage protein
MAEVLGDIARAKGMTQVARDAGLSHESLMMQSIRISALDICGYDIL